MILLIFFYIDCPSPRVFAYVSGMVFTPRNNNEWNAIEQRVANYYYCDCVYAKKAATLMH